jgi:hypothetical protein
MLGVAHKNFLAHPVTKEWCRDVRALIEKRGRGEQEKLRKYIESRGLKCSSGELSEVLSGEVYETSEFVEPIHDYFGWPAPLSPTASRDAGELLHVYMRLTPAQRELLDRAGDVLKGESGEQAKKSLTEMLKLFPGTAQND